LELKSITDSIMGNLFVKDCPDIKKKTKKRPGGVGWKAPGAERGTKIN